MNRSLLRSKMVLFNDEGKDLAAFLGISEQSFSSKMNGKSDFNYSEIKKIIKKYNLMPNEVIDIFFA